jgi:hypothetical protein
MLLFAAKNNFSKREPDNRDAKLPTAVFYVMHIRYEPADFCCSDAWDIQQDS